MKKYKMCCDCQQHRFFNTIFSFIYFKRITHILQVYTIHNIYFFNIKLQLKKFQILKRLGFGLGFKKNIFTNLTRMLSMDD